MRADAPESVTFQLMDRGLNASMPLPHGPERRVDFPHLVGRVAMSFLGQCIERQTRIQLLAIVRAVKPMIETHGVKCRIGNLAGFNQRHCGGHVAAFPLQLCAEHEAVFVNQNRRGNTKFYQRFRFALAV